MTLPRLNANAERKRAQLATYTQEQLAPHDCVQAVVAIGSVATGEARADSDIDAVVFMEPLDLYITPAESLWRPRDDSYHSIFSDDPSLELEGIQLDLHRLDLATWRSDGFVWPEHSRAEFADAWIVFDRTGGIDELIRDRATMTEADRLTVLDEVLIDVDGLLPTDLGEMWSVLGPVEAFDRLHGAWESLARGFFAYNWRWRPWRSRSLRGLLRLAHIPEALRLNALPAVQSSNDSFDGYLRRAQVLHSLFGEFVDRLTADHIYGADAVTEAFVRLHDEPGRAWNMDEWNEKRRRPPGAL